VADLAELKDFVEGLRAAAHRHAAMATFRLPTRWRSPASRFIRLTSTS